MNMLFVIHYPVFGGPHNQALRLTGLLNNYGWKTIVLLPDDPGRAAGRLRDGGVEVVQMPLHRFRATVSLSIHANFALGFWPEILAIRRLLRKRSIDLVVIGGLVNPHAAIAARLEGVPVAWQITDSRLPHALRVAFMSVVKRWSDSIMYNGESLIDLHGGKTDLRCPWFVYYPPVDTERFRASGDARQRCLARFGIPLDAMVIGTVANLNPQKGIEYFIRAASLIYQSIPNVWFMIVGASYDTHPRYNAFIQDEVARSGIPQERFVFTGEQPDVENYYAAMDINLITSVPNSEGTTTTGMEAMACGIPVVATDVGSVREVVDDGITGFIVPPLDPKAIANRVIRLLNDSELRRNMGERARKHAVEKYDAKICADTHMRAFEMARAYYEKKRMKKSLLTNLLVYTI